MLKCRSRWEQTAEQLMSYVCCSEAGKGIQRATTVGIVAVLIKYQKKTIKCIPTAASHIMKIWHHRYWRTKQISSPRLKEQRTKLKRRGGKCQYSALFKKTFEIYCEGNLCKPCLPSDRNLPIGYFMQMTKCMFTISNGSFDDAYEEEFWNVKHLTIDNVE